jgi:hypothetical protein
MAVAVIVLNFGLYVRSKLQIWQISKVPCTVKYWFKAFFLKGWTTVDLNTKTETYLKWRTRNDVIIDLGPLKFNVKRGKM